MTRVKMLFCLCQENNSISKLEKLKFVAFLCWLAETVGCYKGQSHREGRVRLPHREMTRPGKPMTNSIDMKKLRKKNQMSLKSYRYPGELFLFLESPPLKVNVKSSKVIQLATLKHHATVHVNLPWHQWLSVWNFYINQSQYINIYVYIYYI